MISQENTTMNNSVADIQVTSTTLFSQTATKVTIATISIVLACATMYYQVLPFFGEQLQNYYGISLQQFGLLLGSGMIPGAITVFIAGMFIERWGPLAVLGALFLFSAFGMTIAAVGTTWKIMLVGYVFMACSYGSVYLCVQSLLIQFFPTRRRQMISLSLIITSVLGILLPLWAEILQTLSENILRIEFSQVLHIPFGVLAGGLFVAGLIYLRLFRGSRLSTRSQGYELPRLNIHLPKGSWSLVLILGIHGSCDMALFAWIPRILESESYARITFRPGVVMSAFMLMYTISRCFLALLPDRIGKRALVVVPGILGGIVALLGVISKNQALTSIGLIVGAFFWSLELPCGLSLLAKRDTDTFAKAQAIVIFLWGIGGFLLTSFIGFFAEIVPAAGLWSMLMLPLAGYPLFGILSAIWLAHYGKLLPCDKRS